MYFSCEDCPPLAHQQHTAVIMPSTNVQNGHQVATLNGEVQYRNRQRRATVTPTRGRSSQTYKNLYAWATTSKGAYSSMLPHFHKKVVQSTELQADLETIDLSIQNAWNDLNFVDDEVGD